MKKQVKLLAKLIKASHDEVATKDAMCIVELDPVEVAYKTLFCLESFFGSKPPKQPENKYRYWYSEFPLTPVAVKIGKMAAMSLDSDEVEELDRNMRNFRLGWHILTIFFDIETLQLTKGINKRDKYRIRVTKGEERFLADMLGIIDTIDPMVPIYTRPQFKKPTPFDKFYHPHAGPMVRNVNKDLISEITKEEMPRFYQAINRHMANPYVINIDLLEVLLQCQDDDMFTFKNKVDLTDIQLEGLERERDKVLEIAKMVGKRTFWEFMFYDSRGRLYSSSVYLSHAGSKLSKSLYLFKEKKVMGTDGWFWTLVHTANCFGYDKASIDERFDFAEDRLDEWMLWAADPVSNKGWQDADSPYEFLAAIMDIYKAVNHEGGYKLYPSNLMISWDASCSGLQVLSALARDEDSGALCNLTESTVRGDYYLEVADKVWEECVYTQEEEDVYNKITKDLRALDSKVSKAFESKLKDRITEVIEERRAYKLEHKEAIADSAKVFWAKLKHKRRKICKRPCMTYFYTCSARTMANQMYSDFSSEPGYEGVNSSYCFWLSRRLYSACVQRMAKPTALMELFIKLGLDAYSEGENFSLYSPVTGFKFVQTYRSDLIRRPKVFYKGKMIQPKVVVGEGVKIDRQKVISGTSPNIVHMLDSQVVAGLLLSVDYTLSTIHDSFSTHSADAGKLYEDTRNVFIGIFKEDILKDILQQRGKEDYYDGIDMGDLDLDGASENEHCFS